MFAALSRRMGGSSLPDPHYFWLDQVIETVGGDIGKAGNFEKRLLPVLESVNDYFMGQIGHIPGALDLGRHAQEKDAATAAVFSAGEDIVQALGRSLEVKDSLPRLAMQDGEHVHALLGVRRRPVSAGGDPDRFADHTLRSLAPGLSDTRDFLAFAAFRRILNEFTEHVNKLRRKDHLLKIEWNIRNETVPQLDERERNEYVSVHDLTPETLLEGLIGWLSAPDRYFRIDPAGTELPGVDKSHPVSRLPTLHCSDRRQWSVCIVRFSVAEGLQALEQETHHHRHIFI